ncbi:MAG: type II toxin-antitoxin system HigB family toxin [Cyanobacteria bacterium HKST-UBA02]|nr:type II toxin-antitoxin system HigB family toxin [Cyanobacteria bacterium HKST-UBA02]
MQIIHWGRARKFFQKHRSAEIPLKQWRAAVQAADWQTFPDVRKTFSSADWVDGQIVFDIKGNDFRLIAIARFRRGRVYVRHVLTHEEYDRGDWKVKRR